MHDHSDIERLLEQYGARQRGRRFDCPKCETVRSVAILPVTGEYRVERAFCHKCEWKATANDLRREMHLEVVAPSPGQVQAGQRMSMESKELKREYHALIRELSHVRHTIGQTRDPGDDRAWSKLAFLHEREGRVERRMIEIDDRIHSISRGGVMRTPENDHKSDWERLASERWKLANRIERSGLIGGAGVDVPSGEPIPYLGREWREIPSHVRERITAVHQRECGHDLKKAKEHSIGRRWDRMTGVDRAIVAGSIRMDREEAGRTRFINSNWRELPLAARNAITQRHEHQHEHTR
jgi:hypothetical protein